MALDARTKRRLFVDYYLGDAKGNATIAARMAGYGSPKMAGSRLMTFDDVSQAIEARLVETAMHSREVLARVSRLAKSDMDDYLKFDESKPEAIPTFDFPKARKRAQLGVIKKIKKTTRTIPRKDAEPETEVTVELELYKPHDALGLLAKYHKLVDGQELPPADDTVTAERTRKLARVREERSARKADAAT